MDLAGIAQGSMQPEPPYLLIILGMCLVSYLPRLVPALFISRIKLSPYFKRFLDLIPYTAMTALVFPGIFYSVPGHMDVTYFGAAAAVLAAVLRLPLSITVCIAVAVVLGLLYFQGI